MRKKDHPVRSGPFASIRDSRIGLAVAVGVLLGALWSLFSPHGLLSTRSSFTTTISVASSFPRVLSQASETVNGVVGCVSADSLKLLKTDLNGLREENERLKKMNAEIRARLRAFKQERDAAQKQLLALAPSVKAGPAGMVKSLRTNRAVEGEESLNPSLAHLLSEVAINREVIVGVSNYQVRSMLKLWFESMRAAGVKNFLVVALDDATADFCRQNGVPVYRKDANVSAVQKGTGDNHAISGLKFHLLREFLVLGYAVLLSDVDIVYFRNPFHYLHRDCDVEAMTDGYDNQTAYGFDDVKDDPKMGWSRYAHTMRVWVFNSGFFYIRPTIPAIELLDRVTERLAKEKAWDQAVFNEELFYPSHPCYEGLHASKRVMDYLLFMNSKVMFTIIRKDRKYDAFTPAVLHVNYHPEKYERMVALMDYFAHGKKDALNKFPDGSEW